MNTLSLSVSNPSRANGSSLRNSLSTSVNRRCSRTNSGAHSVQPVAMSVSTKVCTKLPFATGPLCDLGTVNPPPRRRAPPRLFTRPPRQASSHRAGDPPPPPTPRQKCAHPPPAPRPHPPAHPPPPPLPGPSCAPPPSSPPPMKI